MYTHVLQQHQIVRPRKFEFVRERRAVYSFQRYTQLDFCSYEIWQQCNLQNHLIGCGRHFRLERAMTTNSQQLERFKGSGNFFYRIILSHLTNIVTV